MLTVAVCAACTKNPGNNNENVATHAPVVGISFVEFVAGEKAIVNAIIVSDGGGSISECGVCWSTQSHPVISGNHTIADEIAMEFSCDLSRLEIGTIYYVRAYAINSKGIDYSDELTVLLPVGNGCTGSYNDHNYVDLGLPSGRLWATCNVGAYTPEDYGDYFAWGEVLKKDFYNWSTYQFYNVSDGTINKYFNYPNIGETGYTDDLYTLLPEDDAATANWGVGWRMPIEDEWRELRDNTISILTRQNGVYGMLFIATNGLSLFLPASGSRYENDLGGDGEEGYYWASSLGSGNSSKYSFVLSFYYGPDVVLCSRDIGRSVRAVCSGQRNNP